MEFWGGSSRTRAVDSRAHASKNSESIHNRNRSLLVALRGIVSRQRVSPSPPGLKATSGSSRTFIQRQNIILQPHTTEHVLRMLVAELQQKSALSRTATVKDRAAHSTAPEGFQHNRDLKTRLVRWMGKQVRCLPPCCQVHSQTAILALQATMPPVLHFVCLYTLKKKVC